MINSFLNQKTLPISYLYEYYTLNKSSLCYIGNLDSSQMYVNTSKNEFLVFNTNFLVFDNTKKYYSLVNDSNIDFYAKLIKFNGILIINNNTNYNLKNIQTINKLVLGENCTLILPNIKNIENIYFSDNTSTLIVNNNIYFANTIKGVRNSIPV